MCRRYLYDIIKHQIFVFFLNYFELWVNECVCDSVYVFSFILFFSSFFNIFVNLNLYI